MDNKKKKVFTVVLLGVCFVGGVLRAVLPGGNVVAIIGGTLFSLLAAAAAVIVIKNPPAEKRSRREIVDILQNGGLAGVVLILQGIMVAGTGMNRIEKALPGLLFIAGGAVLIVQAADRTRRGRIHNEDTLRAWDELERKGAEARGRKVMACPRCKELVYEDEDVCERCGNIFLHNYEQHSEKKRET